MLKLLSYLFIDSAGSEIYKLPDVRGLHSTKRRKTEVSRPRLGPGGQNRQNHDLPAFSFLSQEGRTTIDRHYNPRPSQEVRETIFQNYL